MKQVFISHSSIDKEIADRVVDSLEVNEVACWIAPRDIPAGRNYAAEITKGIRECPILLLVFSENSNASPAVIREVQMAFEEKKIIIPLRIHTILPGDELNFYLSGLQWWDVSPDNLIFDGLLKDISKALDVTSFQSVTPVIPGVRPAKVIRPSSRNTVIMAASIILCTIIAVGAFLLVNMGGDEPQPEEPMQAFASDSAPSLPPEPPHESIPESAPVLEFDTYDTSPLVPTFMSASPNAEPLLTDITSLIADHAISRNAFIFDYAHSYTLAYTFVLSDTNAYDDLLLAQGFVYQDLILRSANAMDIFFFHPYYNISVMYLYNWDEEIIIVAIGYGNAFAELQTEPEDVSILVGSWMSADGRQVLRYFANGTGRVDNINADGELTGTRVFTWTSENGRLTYLTSVFVGTQWESMYYFYENTMVTFTNDDGVTALYARILP